MRPIQFFAYHGTSKEYADSILESNQMKPGITRDDHWLGKGSYFFREDYLQAKIWAEVNPNLSKPKTVIEVELSADFDKVLHLDTRKGIMDLKNYVNYLIQSEGIEFFEENKNTIKLVHFVFSSISESTTWFIIRTFDTPAKVDDELGLTFLSFLHKKKIHIFNQHGPQVCLRNNNAILALNEVNEDNTTEQDSKNSKEIRFSSTVVNRGGKDHALFKKSRRNVANR